MKIHHFLFLLSLSVIMVSLITSGNDSIYTSLGLGVCSALLILLGFRFYLWDKSLTNKISEGLADRSDAYHEYINQNIDLSMEDGGSPIKVNISFSSEISGILTLNNNGEVVEEHFNQPEQANAFLSALRNKTDDQRLVAVLVSAMISLEPYV